MRAARTWLEPGFSTGAHARAFVDGLRPALAPWIVARVVVAASWVAAVATVNRFPIVPEPLKTHVPQGLLGWDAVRYLQIASQGYEQLPRKEVRFFPLFPLLIRAVDWCLPGGAGTAALAISNVAALGIGALIYRVAKSEGHTPDVARAATWFAMLSPAGFVLAWGYAESIFNLFVATVLLTVRSRRWFLAAGAAALAALTRPVGILLVVPIVIEGVRALREHRRGSELLRVIVAVLAPLVSTSMYLVWVGATFGNPFLPYTIQTSRLFRGSPGGATSAFATAAGALVTGEISLVSVRVIWVVLAVVLLVVLVRRWPASYSAFAAVSLAVVLSASHLGSFERYTLATVPTALALATAAREAERRWAVIVCFSAAMALYGFLAFSGVYVP